MQNLYYHNLQNLGMMTNDWAHLKHAAATVGKDAIEAVEFCSQDTVCRNLVWQGADAVYKHYHHADPQTFTELEFNNWLHEVAHKLEHAGAAKVGDKIEKVVEGTVEWCEHDAKCEALVVKYGPEVAKKLMHNEFLVLQL